MKEISICKVLVICKTLTKKHPHDQYETLICKLSYSIILHSKSYITTPFESSTLCLKTISRQMNTQFHMLILLMPNQTG